MFLVYSDEMPQTTHWILIKERFVWIFQVLREASLTLEMSKWMNESLPEEEETPTTTSPAAQSESSQV